MSPVKITDTGIEIDREMLLSGVLELVEVLIHAGVATIGQKRRDEIADMVFQTAGEVLKKLSDGETVHNAELTLFALLLLQTPLSIMVESIRAAKARTTPTIQ